MTLICGAALQSAMMESEPEPQYDEPVGPEQAWTRADHHAHYEAADIEVGDVLEWDDGAESEVVAIFDARQPQFDDEELVDGEQLVHYVTDAPEYDEGEQTQACMPSWLLGGDIARGSKEVRR